MKVAALQMISGPDVQTNVEMATELIVQAAKASSVSAMPTSWQLLRPRAMGRSSGRWLMRPVLTTCG
jgi:hypothetical protein